MAPRIKIPVHLFGYGIALMPGVAYAIYYKRNQPSDEQLEQVLRENYASKIQKNRDKKEEMVNFIQNIKQSGGNPEQEEKFQTVLNAGKGQIKRQHAIDEKLYGTEEGVSKRKEMEEEAKRIKDGKKQQSKGDTTRKESKISSTSVPPNIEEDNHQNKVDNAQVKYSGTEGLKSTSMTTLALAGSALAVIATIFIGGNKR